MKNLGKDLSQIVLKLAENVNVSDFNLNVQMLNVAWAMDGKRSLGDVAREDHYDLKDLTKKVDHLLALGVLEVNKSSQSTIDQEFIKFLTAQLSKELGPVSDILIADAAKALGHPMTHFPVHELPSLINLLSQEFRGQDDAVAFKRTMETMIKKKNY